MTNRLCRSCRECRNPDSREVGNYTKERTYPHAPLSKIVGLDSGLITPLGARAPEQIDQKER